MNGSFGLLAKLDWYIVQRLTRRYAKKRQDARWMGSFQEVKVMAYPAIKAHRYAVVRNSPLGARNRGSLYAGVRFCRLGERNLR
ncbi:hypothetical protein DQG23_23400 [Paenibacillus contaminans]|uniref:Group II intron maturase-specific domain-containing protein n=1 Tax=Paenibacillus contaminans TaxID=450362 RepID=A0A329MFH6_9BACL|nr:hypothetical protein DQG23_23400 [Paenibacillus contaminans]